MGGSFNYKILKVNQSSEPNKEVTHRRYPHLGDIYCGIEAIDPTAIRMSY